MPRLLTPSRVADFRNRLCDVAMQLLAEVGYDGFNMRELAARLGVSAMTAYRYFKDKDDILATVRIRAFERLADVLAQADSTSGTPAKRCAAIARAYVDFAEDEPIYYRLMFEIPRTSQEAVSQAAEARMRGALFQHLSALKDSGTFRGDPDVIGRTLLSALHGIVMLRLCGKLSDAEAEQVLSEFLRMIGAGADGLEGAHLFLTKRGSTDSSRRGTALQAANTASLSAAS